MEVGQISVYALLQVEVLHKLRCHRYVDGGMHVFQYLILPSFEPLHAYDVFERGGTMSLYRTTWRSDLDSQKWSTPAEQFQHPQSLEPTISVQSLCVSTEALSKLSRDLCALQLPIGAPAAHFGCDGTSYEIAIGQFDISARCRLSWWMSPPREWDELRQWISKAEDLFEKAQSTLEIAPNTKPLLSDAEIQEAARGSFYRKQYALTEKLIAEIQQRRTLSSSERKMLEICRKQLGNG